MSQMGEKTKLALVVLAAAVPLGVLGDALLRATPWGLNVFLWVAALVAAACVAARRKGRASPGGWPWALALTFAALFVWRDSLTLRFLDVLAVLAAMSLALMRSRGARVRLAGVFEYALGGIVAGMNAAFGVFPLLMSDVRWKEIPRTRWTKHAFPVVRGLLIAVPLLLVFGGLFVAADAVFEGLVNSTFNLDAEKIFSHVIVTSFFAWTAAGYLRGAYVAEGPLPFRRTAEAPRGLGLSTPEDKRPPAADAGAAKDARVSDLTDEEAARKTMPPGGYRFSAGEDEAANASRESVVREDETAGGEGAETFEGKSADAGSGASESAPEAGGATAGASAQGSSAGTPPQGSPTADATTPGAPPSSATQSFPRPSLGIVEVGVVLGLLDLLFFSFVAVQISYLFGNAQHVITSDGLTFSDYARRGFFELVWVAVLALPLLLSAHWLLRKTDARHVRLFNALAGAMVLMLFVIMASAFWRMRLYQAAYGQTELRFYTTAFMGWLGLVFVWFALTVLRGRRERFAFGALVAWFAVLGALHAVNPGDLIVRSNLEHARAAARPERFDALYVVSLGADAVPALVEHFDELGERERASVAGSLARWLGPESRGDWRSWNYSRWRAARAVEGREAEVREWEARGKSEAEARVALARRMREAAFAPVPGTAFTVLVERRPVDSSPGYRRTATLLAGDAAVASLELPADDGTRTRIEVYRVSETVFLLLDAYGTYVADGDRRTLTRQDSFAYDKRVFVGAFDVGESKRWGFTPTSDTQAKAVGGSSAEGR